MTDDEKIELLIDTIEAEDPEKIVPDAELADIREWDSMGMMSSIMMFDREFGRELTYVELKGLRTVRDIMALMERA